MKIFKFRNILFSGLLLLMLGCKASANSPVDVNITGTQVSAITVGTGWNTWDHWWSKTIDGQSSRYRLLWNDAQWSAYLNLLKESGADWIQLDLYYGNIEPRDSGSDPAVINWSGFTFNNPTSRHFIA